MNLDYLHYLLAVAQSGSISQASKKLHLSQQHLSKIIQSLESEFGATIFERTHRGIKLTPIGQDIINTTAKILTQYHDLTERICQHENQRAARLKGKLHVHTIPSVWEENTIRKTINAFSSAYPLVDITIGELGAKDVVLAIINQPSDIGIITTVAGDQDILIIPDILHFTPCYSVSVNAYAAKDSRFAQKNKSISLKSLAKEPLVVYKPFASKNVPIEDLFYKVGAPNIKYAVSNLITFHDILNGGKAIHVGTYTSSQYLEKNNLVRIPIRDKIYFSTGVLYHQDHGNDPLIKAFADFFENQASSHETSSYHDESVSTD